MSAPHPSPLLVAARFRPPASLGPDRIVRLAAEAGAEGIAADDSIPQDLLRTLAALGLRSGVAVGLGACPIPETALAKGKRLPYLVALDDPDERRAAVKRAAATMASGQELGIPAFTVELGPVGLRTPEAPFRLGHARREMAEGESGHKALRRALDERKARAGAIFDACRASLEPLLGEAGRRGATLILRLAGTPWHLPTPREAHQLLAEFAGAPLAVADCPARQAVREELGLVGPTEIRSVRAADLLRATRLYELTDRVGLETTLSLGTGELDPRPPADLPAEARWLVSGPFDASFKEVLRARRRAHELREQLLLAREKATPAQG